MFLKRTPNRFQEAMIKKHAGILPFWFDVDFFGSISKVPLRTAGDFVWFLTNLNYAYSTDGWCCGWPFHFSNLKFRDTKESRETMLQKMQEVFHFGERGHLNSFRAFEWDDSPQGTKLNVISAPQDEPNQALIFAGGLDAIWLLLWTKK